jgi:Protein of unknown function (DUF2937)
MLKWLIEILDRVFVVIAALLFSQLPLYMQEYEQRLSGHVDELYHQLDALQKIAKQSGKSFEEYVGKFLASPDLDFAKQGAFIEAMQHRYQKLSDALTQLQGASVFSKPFLFIQHLDFEISKASLVNFKPGVLFTLEGLCYVIAGMAAGFVLFKLLGLLRFAFIRNGYQRNQH